MSVPYIQGVSRTVGRRERDAGVPFVADMSMRALSHLENGTEDVAGCAKIQVRSSNSNPASPEKKVMYTGLELLVDERRLAPMPQE